VLSAARVHFNAGALTINATLLPSLIDSEYSAAAASRWISV
jgi:hypothetical protein